MTILVENNSIFIYITGLDKSDRRFRNARLQVFDLKGKLLADLTNQLQLASSKLTWKPSSLSKGMYVVKFSMGKTVITGRAVAH